MARNKNTTLGIAGTGLSRASWDNPLARLSTSGSGKPIAPDGGAAEVMAARRQRVRTPAGGNS